MATVFNALRSLLAQHESANRDDAQGSSRRLQVAACALLLELAHADADFSPAERQQIQDAAMRHFDMDEDAARDLMRVADAARREAVDLHQFTNLIVHHYDEGQRMVLAELMWGVIRADGRLDEQETQLARKLANLIDLRPGYLAEARRRVEGNER